MPKRYFVYILANRPKGAIYIGVTNDVNRRVAEHRNGFSKHTSKYGIYTLVYVEDFQSIDDAIAREKKLKRWKRVWKDELIERVNPNWDDVSNPF